MTGGFREFAEAAHQFERLDRVPASVIETGAESEGGEDVPLDVDVAEDVGLAGYEVAWGQEHDP